MMLGAQMLVSGDPKPTITHERARDSPRDANYQTKSAREIGAIRIEAIKRTADEWHREAL